jgi:hypothetical protein
MTELAADPLPTPTPTPTPTDFLIPAHDLLPLHDCCRYMTIAVSFVFHSITFDLPLNRANPVQFYLFHMIYENMILGVG